MRRLTGATAPTLLAAIWIVAGAACARAVTPLIEPSSSAVALTGGPGTSMVYLARTDSGLVAIDLGWWGAEDAVREALDRLDAEPAEVTDVFLTHSHRDHIGAWRIVAGSEFHLAASEWPALVGERLHEGAVPHWAEYVKPSDLPDSGEVSVRTFSTDTSFVFGMDTLRAYVVPGHTAGSAVYLFRGILFLGDAATWTPWRSFGPARGMYSDDRDLARANLRALWARLPEEGVRLACTAHARCTAFSANFRRDVEH